MNSSRHGRLAGIAYEGLDADQQAVWRAVTEGRRGAASQLVDNGGLIGPFNAMLYSPAIGGRVAALGEALRFDTSLEPSLREVAILAVGAHWRSEFEFWAHSRIGSNAGLDSLLIEGIAGGRLPDAASSATQLVHRVARSLLTDGRIDDGLYSDAVDLLGDQAMVELVALVGYYCLVSFTLNAFEVPLPAGVEARWA